MQPDETVQGALELMYTLQDYLNEIVGMKGCSLATLAGAHGELAGMLMIRAYHLNRGDDNRDLVLIPDSAHGTNPASATMAGCRVESIPSNNEGNIDVAVLKEKLSSKVAGIMITLPNTLGLFENDITEICNIAHGAGALVYGDGANMNALLGQVKPGKLGFDVVHINLHKTFSTPHGGGGPGAGPVCVSDSLVPFLPNPIVCRSRIENKDAYRLDKPSKSIGRVGSFHGNFGVLVRAYSYIRILGKTGLKEISYQAVLNANYLRKKLKDYYHVPFDRPCMHEVVISAKNQLVHGVKALDIAKRLLDYGIHPPTMYFPLIVEEALMIEPTETESKETIDYFIEVMRKIYQESIDDPRLLHEAPHYTSVSRLDEAKAAREPDLRWTSSSES
jgi:glycine dehydrogenase subunit 2